jgi:hypothetical protein
MRTTVDVDEKLLAEAKVVAARTQRTLSAVVNDALRVALRHREEVGERQPVTLPTDGEGGLLPGVDLEDREAVAARLGDDRFGWAGGRAAP